MGVYVVVGLIGGAICAMLASGKGRNPGGWFAIGFLLPLIGIVMVLVLPAMGELNQAQAGAPSAPPPRAPDAPPGSAEAEIARLAELRTRGLVSENEFERRKGALLAQAAPPTDAAS